jgi:hypothetical protein
MVHICGCDVTFCVICCINLISSPFIYLFFVIIIIIIIYFELIGFGDLYKDK